MKPANSSPSVEGGQAGSTAEATGSILGQGTKIPHAMQRSQKKERRILKNEYEA